MLACSHGYKHPVVAPWSQTCLHPEALLQLKTTCLTAHTSSVSHAPLLRCRSTTSLAAPSSLCWRGRTARSTGTPRARALTRQWSTYTGVELGGSWWRSAGVQTGMQACINFISIALIWPLASPSKLLSLDYDVDSCGGLVRLRSLEQCQVYLSSCGAHTVQPADWEPLTGCEERQCTATICMYRLVMQCAG